MPRIRVSKDLHQEECEVQQVGGCTASDLNAYYRLEVARFTGDDTSAPTTTVSVFTEEQQIVRYSRNIGFWMAERVGCEDRIPEDATKFYIASQHLQMLRHRSQYLFPHRMLCEIEVRSQAAMSERLEEIRKSQEA